MIDGRVLVCDPWYPLDEVRAIVAGAERGNVAAAGAGVAALLVSPDSPVSGADIGRMPDLRVIATASTGVDHIDLGAAAAAGVEVRDAGDYCSQEVADHALALLVAQLRGVPAQDRSVQAGGFDHTAGGTPRRLRGTRLAVLGYGRIGRGLAERAEALGMDVRFFDPYVAGGEADLDPLLEWAEAVSLHMPLTRETAGLLDGRRLGLMRPGTVLINTARAAIVDREAIKAATHLRAAFDALWERPPGPDLLGLDHLVITPYVAWYSAETEDEPYLRAARAAAAVLGE
ncbi:MAG TPA: NAD(P)-dependent oxidoreductase [Gaiellales bacterium]|nr:NAD(P)-dependent oxidoreductase [Gaiellales bacterium]